MLSVVNTNNAPAAVGPYSQAIQTGNLVFTSGQIPLDPKTGQMVGTTVEEQAHQAFKNLQAVLEASRTGLDKVIKTTVFIKDMNDFAKVNAIYAAYFSAHKPARSCVEVARLPKDALVEIEAIAYI